MAFLWSPSCKTCFFILSPNIQPFFRCFIFENRGRAFLEKPNLMDSLFLEGTMQTFAFTAARPILPLVFGREIPIPWLLEKDMSSTMASERQWMLKSEPRIHKKDERVPISVLVLSSNWNDFRHEGRRGAERRSKQWHPIGIRDRPVFFTLPDISGELSDVGEGSYGLSVNLGHGGYRRPKPGRYQFLMAFAPRSEGVPNE